MDDDANCRYGNHAKNHSTGNDDVRLIGDDLENNNEESQSS